MERANRTGVMSTPSSRVRLRTVALPAEHGGWGFLLEPILLGLIVSPSFAGVCLSIAAVAAFLLRRPLALLLRSIEPMSASPRRRAAMYLSVAYSVVAGVALAIVVRVVGTTPLPPLVVAFPLVVVYLFFDTRKRSKRLVPEIAGPLGLAGVAPAIALAGGFSGPSSWALWAVIAARTIPSIFFVRARLRLRRGGATNRIVVIGWHLGSLMVIWALSRAGLAPFLAVAALLILLIRAGHGLSPNRHISRVTRIGILEIAYGLFYVIVTGIGYRMSI